MLSCRRGTWLRLATLLGLVVLLVGVGGDAWAQYIVADDVPAVFPYLSPDLTQRNLLINAFNFQMSMFGAISNTVDESGGLKALNYLAITGCLVGALMIIFNPKHRKIPIIASWLVVVVITVFAPYGSKILFYPVASGNLTKDFATQKSFSDCSAMPDRCGFTPQLAAIHVAATVQRLFGDVFRSMGWKGIVERAIAESELKQSDFLAMPKNIYNDDIPNYKKECNGKIDFDALSAVMAGTSNITLPTFVTNGEATPATTEAALPISLEARWANINKYFDDPDVDGKSAPPTVLLFGDADFMAQKTANKWSTSAQSAYETALTELYSIVTEDTGKKVQINGCSGSSGCNASIVITADQALKKLDEFDFFRVINAEKYGDKLLPGFFFTWTGSANYHGGDLENNPSAEEARRCYKVTKNEGVGRVTVTDTPTECGAQGGQYYPTSVWPSDQAGDFNLTRKKEFSELADTPWRGIYKLMQGDSSSALMAMPTGGGKSLGVAKIIDGKVKAAPIVNSSRKDCVGDGIIIMTSIIDSTVGEDGKAALFNKLAKMLKNEAPVPERLSLSDVYEVPSTGDVPIPDSFLKKAQTAATYFVTVFNGRIDDAERNNHAKLENDKYRRAVLLSSFFAYVDASSRAKWVGLSSDESQTSEASETPKVVGSSQLTWLGGNVAYFLGSWIAKIGSWFVGPLSAALIYFLSLLIDIAMLALIVLTPFLFIAGLFIPSSAIGVLSIVILGAFILKFVPVTLIILNNLGELIYSFIGVSGGEDATVMQSLIIIAMAGLYANLVGMTFVLLFKLGDPAAVLGRFTALDGSAKQLADRGMAAALTVAAAAAAGVGGALGGGYGALSLRGGARAAAARLGVPANMMDAAENAMKQNSAAEEKVKDDEASTATEGDAATIPDGLTDEERANRDAYGNKLSAAEQLRLGPAAGGDTLSAAQEDFKLSPEKAYQLVKDGKLRDGGYDYSVDSEGRISRSEAGVDAMPGNLGEDMGNITMKNGIGTAVPGQGVDIEAMNAKMGAVEATAKAAADAEASINSSQDPSGGTSDVTTGGGATTAAATAAATAGIASQVTVVGGQLDKLGEVGNVANMKPLAVETGQTLNERMQEVEKARAAEIAAATKEENNSIINDPNATTAQKQVAEQSNKALDSAEDAGDVKNIISQRDVALRKAGTTIGMSSEKEKYIRSMNDQIAEALSSVEVELGKAGINDVRKKELTAYKEELLKMDTAGLTQGELFSKLGTLDSMKKYMDARGAADKVEGWGFVGKSALSGVYGAFAGAGGGLAKIPVLGPALVETLNERYQAPERARAWAAAGGYGAWSAAQKDAQRMGFYQKEMGPLAAAHQYNSMQAIGGFQAQADIARQAASEAVAKSRSQYESLLADTRGRGRSENQNFMSAGDLYGLGRMEAANRVASVRQEAFVMQGASLVVKKANIDGNMQLQMDGNKLDTRVTDMNLVLTPDLLDKSLGDIGAKKINGSLDDMMITHYGLAEKQYQRGNAGWDATRDMTRSVAAASQFARKDVDTDYMIGGHIKMVEGKLRYKESQGQYKKLVEFRNQENAIKAQEVDVILKENGGLQAALSKANYKAEIGFTPAQVRTAQREALESLAKESLGKQKVLMPLEAVFDEAHSNGLKKYVEKAYVAAFNTAAQDIKIYDSVQKAASSMLLTVDDLNAKAGKNVSLRLGNFFESMDMAPKSFFDIIHKAGGQKHENMNKLISIAKDVLNERRGDNFIINTDSVKDKYARGSQAISGASYNSLLQKYEQAGEKAAADYLRSHGRQDKATGNWIFSEVLIEEGGKVERDNWKRKD